jgi:TatD DNase family protein
MNSLGASGEASNNRLLSRRKGWGMDPQQKIQMIDCHTHLTDDAFAMDREAVLHRAHRAGVRAIAIVGQDLAENRAVLAAARQAREARDSAAGGRAGGEAGGEIGTARPVLLPFLGLHPDRFADSKPPFPDSETAAIVALIREHAGDIVGIGEVGLDYWVCQGEERRAAQRDALSTLSALAGELDLPLNVHSRSAGRHTLELLMEQGNTKVLMHAFDGKAGHALKGAEAGFLFSIPPSIVRSPQKVKLARLLPLEALALETDSPVLGPVAGERNEPGNVAIAAPPTPKSKACPRLGCGKPAWRTPGGCSGWTSKHEAERNDGNREIPHPGGADRFWRGPPWVRCSFASTGRRIWMGCSCWITGPIRRPTASGIPNCSTPSTTSTSARL